MVVLDWEVELSISGGMALCIPQVKIQMRSNLVDVLPSLQVGPLCAAAMVTQLPPPFFASSREPKDD